MNNTKDDVLLAHVKKTIDLSTEAKLDFYRTHSQAIVDATKIMADTVLNGGKILIFGNGGSAADAQHMAAEMTGRMLLERKKPLAAIALTTDTSALTAIANDYTYEDIFLFQLQALGRKGDLAIAISTSGNSKNVVKAVVEAKKIGMRVVSLTGGSGGKLKEMADVSLNVEKGTNSSMIQETHITVEHLMVDMMDRFHLPSDYISK